MYYAQQYKENQWAERDAIIRHYISLHPEDFPAYGNQNFQVEFVFITKKCFLQSVRKLPIFSKVGPRFVRRSFINIVSVVNLYEIKNLSTLTLLMQGAEAETSLTTTKNKHLQIQSCSN